MSVSHSLSPCAGREGAPSMNTIVLFMHTMRWNLHCFVVLNNVHRLKYGAYFFLKSLQRNVVVRFASKRYGWEKIPCIMMCKREAFLSIMARLCRKC